MIGTTLLNRYRIEAQLGQGGMGIVYRAHDTLLNRPTALKVLNASGLGTTGRTRLLAEAQAAARLNHPNIVGVYDAGEAEGQPFIVMELVEGESLRAYQPQALEETLLLARQICTALQHAHRAGIIHRDLKPENIILTPTGTLKLMDFGLARSADMPRVTEEGAILGTMSYLAPELIEGQPASIQSDLYALGVVLYELVAGCPPFSGDTMIVVLSQHLYAEASPPSTHNTEVPAWLDEVILRLLSKQPEDRPISAEAVLQSLIETRPVETRPLSSRPAPPHNLPAHLNKFIGREKEMGEVAARLAESRLVTLVGPGGIGKTRLSLQVAQQLLPEYPNGVWLVELAPLTDPVLVLQTVATVLNVHEEAGRPWLTALTDYFREKTSLLVLDNCEHVIEVCAQLAEHLLHHCPNLRLLASSRETLGVGGEIAFPVSSLSLPSTLHTSPSQLASSEAVQLFVDRAATALPGFALTDANVPAIAQVCRRLDGIALAIELAAVRVKTLKVEQIAGRLDSAFRLLTGGSRTALPRQQTLKATIDWSYNLLSDPERVLLQRLSVFAGGWNLAAAESVCSGEGLEPDEVLDLLTQLVNKSLVLSEREPGEEARYRLLETIRQYAQERLAESGEDARLRQRHATFFTRLAAEAEPELRGPNQHLWVERLDGEHDNLRAALGWLLEHNIEAAAQLAGYLFWFWHTICYWSEGRSWHTRLLAAATTPPGPPSLSTAARAQTLCEAGWLAVNDIDIDQALALSEAGLALYRELGDIDGIAMALNTLGWVAYYQNEHERAKALVEEGLTYYRALGFKWRMAHLLNLLGNIARVQGKITTAITCYQESLAYAREIGDFQGIAYSLVVWSHAAWAQGDLAQAAPLLEEGLTLAREIRLDWVVAYSLNTLGDIARAQDDYKRAAGFYQECQALWERLGSKRELAGLRTSQAWLARLQGNYGQATGLFGEALRSWQEVGDKRRIAACLEGLAGVAVALGQVKRAVQLFGAAETMREAGGVPLPSVERANYDRDLATARAGLDEAGFSANWTEGQAMTPEEAIAYGLEEIDS